MLVEKKLPFNCWQENVIQGGQEEFQTYSDKK